MTGWFRRLLVSPAAHRDLFVAWLVTVALHTLVPSENLLARGDLAPWATMCLVLVAALRAAPLGESPHPSLAPRAAWWRGKIGTLGMMLAPPSLLLAYDTAAGAYADPLGRAIAPSLAVMLCGLVALLVFAGMENGRTAWRPPGPSSAVVWTLRAVPLLALAAVFGLFARATFDPAALAETVGPIVGPVEPEPTWTTSALLGTQFLVLGLLPDRIEALRQRRAAGRRDGRTYRPPLFPFLLAALGPGLGLALLFELHRLFDMPITFAQSTVVSLHVFAWAAVLWPPRVPVALACVLHEVVPAGGGDPLLAGGVPSFDRPPDGALQLNPIALRRVGLMHAWIVPVQDPRIEEFDDPVRSLWPRPSLPLAYHVLGEASFEPDEATQLPQWHSITVRLDEHRDVGRLSQGNVQTRRLAVLRPFPSRARGAPRILRTYRWEDPVRSGALQVVDATTESISLQDGDILVLSTEGVARAFELELGAPVYGSDPLASRRGPHLEDYVGLS